MATLKLSLLFIAFGLIVNQVHSVSFEVISLPHVDVVSNLLINVSSDSSLFVSSKCRSQLSNFGMRLKERQVDALKILDSWAKFKSGFLHYQPYDFGDYRQCQDTKLLSSVASRYFMLEMHVSSHQDIHNNATQWDMLLYHRVEQSEHFPHRFAVCLPSECSIQDLQTILDSHYVSPHVHPFNISVHSGDSIADDDSLIKRITPIQVLALICLGIPVLLTILASVTGTDNKVIQSFNIKLNIQKLFQEPVPLEDTRLNYFYFFRVLYTVSASAGHTVFGYNRESMAYVFDTSHFMFRNTNFAIPDTSLGICFNLAITTLVSLQSLQSSKNKSFLNQFCSRYFRMIPVATTVSFIFIVLPLIVPRHLGPISDAMIDYSSKACSRYFHQDLTMTADFGDGYKKCNPVTWFLSLDLHMFLLFFIPLKILSHNPKKGIIVISVMTAAALVMHGLYLTFLFPEHLSILFSWDHSYNDLHETLELLYMHPMNYIAVKGFCIFIGIMIFQTRKTSREMSTMNYVYTVIGFIGTLMTYTANTEFQNSSRSTQILVAIVFRPVFLSCCMLFTLNSLAKSSNFMKICGSYTMVILSRLTFSLFMVHPVFVIFLQSQQHTPLLGSRFTVFKSGITVLMMSLPLSFIIALVVEYPVANLLKLFTSTKRDPNVDSNHNKKQF